MDENGEALVSELTIRQREEEERVRKDALSERKQQLEEKERSAASKKYIPKYLRLKKTKV